MELPLIYTRPFTLSRIRNICVFKTKNKRNEFSLMTDRKRNLESIRVAVENVTGINIKQTCRETDIVNARRVYLFLASHLCKSSLTEIGKQVGLTHSSVITNRNKCTSLIEAEDVKIISTLQEVCEFLDVKFTITKI